MATQVHRPSVKTPSASSAWKKKLRDSCLERVRISRREVLWRIRSQESVAAWKRKDVTSTLKSILSDQIKASRPIIDDVVSDSPLTPPKADVWTIQDEACTSPDRTRIPMFTSSCAHPEHSSTDANTCEDEGRLGGDADMLWEYDLRRGASVGLQFGEDELSGEEYEVLLMEMQRALYEDLQESPDLEEQEKVWELEAAQDMRHLEAAQEGPEVLCPICCQLPVRQKGSTLFCLCSFEMDTGSEEMGLQYLQTRIQEVVDAHWEEGCVGQPQFAVEHQFEVDTLCMRCASCSTFHFVL